MGCHLIRCGRQNSLRHFSKCGAAPGQRREVNRVLILNNVRTLQAETVYAMAVLLSLLGLSALALCIWGSILTCATGNCCRSRAVIVVSCYWLRDSIRIRIGRPDSNSNRKYFESATRAVCRHTTNYAHSQFNKNINLYAVCSWDLCLQLYFTCSCTAGARAHTQLPHDNRHWTCKRLPPDSIRDAIRTEISDSQVPNWHLPATRP